MNARSGVVDWWRRFFFAPVSTTTLGLVRIAIGVVLLIWAWSIAGDLTRLFSDEGLLPQQPSRPWVLSLFEAADTPAHLTVVFVVFVAAAVCVLVGFHTRIATVVAFVAMLSFNRRMPFVFNSGDILLRIMLGFLCLAPAGAALSVDRWRADPARFWASPRRAPWALRLIQIQVSLVYLMTVWEKVRGTTWNEGTAVSYALRIEDTQRFAVPQVVVDNLFVSNLATWGTLATELALGLLLWHPRARRFVIPLGIALHLSVSSTLLVGVFSATVLSGYLAFLDSDATDRLITRRRAAGVFWSTRPGTRRVRASREEATT
jgi:hypothetical protein